MINKKKIPVIFKTNLTQLRCLHLNSRSFRLFGNKHPWLLVALNRSTQLTWTFWNFVSLSSFCYTVQQSERTQVRENVLTLGSYPLADSNTGADTGSMKFVISLFSVIKYELLSFYALQMRRVKWQFHAIKAALVNWKHSRAAEMFCCVCTMLH